MTRLQVRLLQIRLGQIRLGQIQLWSVVVLILAALHPAAPAAGAGAASTVDQRLRLDWEVGTRFKHPVIQGYIYNDYLRAASNVQLLVESLDASGTPIGHTVGFVRGTVAFDNRAYFEVPIKTQGASYRVSITGFDWKDAGGTGGAGGM